MVVRNDLGMGKGKIAAQCAHAAVGCVEKAYKKDSPFLNNWMRQGQPKIVVCKDRSQNTECSPVSVVQV